MKSRNFEINSGSRTESLPLIVHEGENVRLRCSATGSPRPIIKWKRQDGKVIPLGSWKSKYIHSKATKISYILSKNGKNPHNQFKVTNENVKNS